jgi:hypothetical protein
MVSLEQQQNQTNRDRGLENNSAWAATLPPGEKGAPDGSNADYAGADATNNVQAAEVNYMYGGAQPPHNGTGAGEGY